MKMVAIKYLVLICTSSTPLSKSCIEFFVNMCIPSIFLLSYSSVKTWYDHTVNYNEAPSAADEELVSPHFLKTTFTMLRLHYFFLSLSSIKFNPLPI